MATDSMRLAAVGRSADPHAATREGGVRTKEGACVTDRRGKRGRRVYRKWTGEYTREQRSPPWSLGLRCLLQGGPSSCCTTEQELTRDTKTENTRAAMSIHTIRIHTCALQPMITPLLLEYLNFFLLVLHSWRSWRSERQARASRSPTQPARFSHPEQQTKVHAPFQKLQLNCSVFILMQKPKVNVGFKT